jgi:hypothetical protein
MKLFSKVAIALFAGAAILAASQEPVRAYAVDSVCCLLQALGLC